MSEVTKNNEAAVEEEVFNDPYADIDISDAIYEPKKVSAELYKELFVYMQKRSRSREFIKSYSELVGDKDTENMDNDEAFELIDFQLGELKERVYAELEDDLVSVGELVSSISNRLGTLPNR